MGKSVIAEAVNGYIRGMQVRQGLDRDAEEKAHRESERAYTQSERDRVTDERRQLTDAGRVVDVVAGAGGATKADTQDNRDVGLPGEAAPTPGVVVQGKAYADPAAGAAAAAAANAPEAVGARQAAAYRRIGKPAEAAQLESAAVQQKAAKFTLEREQEKWINEKFDAGMAGITGVDQVAPLLSGSAMAGGRKVTSAVSSDGKTVDLIAHNDDGSTVKLNSKPLENTEEGVKKAIVTFSKSLGPAQKIGFLQQFEQAAEQKRQFEVQGARQDSQFAENKRLQERQIGISAGHLGIAQQGLQLQKAKAERDVDTVLPAAVKLSVQAQDRTIQGIENAINKAETDSMADPAGISKLRARLAVAYEKRDGLINPYMGKAGGAASAAADDPMGYRKPPAQGAQGAPGAPAPAGARAAPTLTMPQRQAAPAPAPAGSPEQQQLAAIPPEQMSAIAMELQNASAERRPPRLDSRQAAILALQEAVAQQQAAQSRGGQDVERQRQAQVHRQIQESAGPVMRRN